MKLVLVHGKYFNSWEASGLASIGAYLKAHEPGLEIRFFQGCFDSDDEIVDGCRDAQIVAFSCTTPTYPHALALCRRIKQESGDVHTVIGGYHPSALGASCLEPAFDQVVTGEGEAAMLAVVRGDRSPVVRGRVMEFDELPWPDRALVRNERNIEVAERETGQRITSFQSHRACPFMCKFCLDGHFKVLYERTRRAPVRHRAAHDLLDEIEAVVDRYGIDLVKLNDPTWNVDIGEVIEFCRAKIERRQSTPFYPNIHATLTSMEMMDAMAAAGCAQIAVGIESGSPKVLRSIGKGVTLDSIRRCVSFAKRAGIRIRGYFLLGMPEETEADLELTKQFAEELDLDEYGFSMLCPYPGTPMYDETTMAKVDWARADEYQNDFWSTRHLTNERIVAWQTHLVERFRERITQRQVKSRRDTP